jgi:hypothetical protein
VTTRAFHVYIVDTNSFTVVDDEGNIADRLCWDEMLGCIAEATHPAIRPTRKPRYMHSPDEWLWQFIRWRRQPAINEIR